MLRIGEVIHRRSRLQRFESGQVGAGRKGLAGAGQHDHAHGVVGSSVVERGPHGCDQRTVERIAFVRAVQRQRRHPLVNGIVNQFIHETFLLSRCEKRHRHDTHRQGRKQAGF